VHVQLDGRDDVFAVVAVEDGAAGLEDASLIFFEPAGERHLGLADGVEVQLEAFPVRAAELGAAHQPLQLPAHQVVDALPSRLDLRRLFGSEARAVADDALVRAPGVALRCAPLPRPAVGDAGAPEPAAVRTRVEEQRIPPVRVELPPDAVVDGLP